MRICFAGLHRLHISLPGLEVGMIKLGFASKSLLLFSKDGGLEWMLPSDNSPGVLKS